MKIQLKIFVDTDAFVALAVNNDANHAKALSLLYSLIDRQVIFFTSNYVFSECITVISQRDSHESAIIFIEKMQSLQNPFFIEWADNDLDSAAIDIFKKQTSKNTSYVDCANMAFMMRLKADAIFSFDEAYRKNKLTLVSEL